MARTTKTKRLQMIVREYERRFPGPFTMNAVAKWALSVRLLPAPGRLVSEQLFADDWDRRFADICAEQITPAL